MSARDTAAEELGALARGLADHLRRAGFLGLTKVPRPAAWERSERPHEAPRPSPGAAQGPASAAPAAPAGPPAGDRPEAPTVLFSRPSPRAPAAPPAARGLPPDVAERAAENRARAAAAGTLEELARAVAACTACELCKTRTQTVFADGTGRARAMFVGEGPGFHEDQQGVPFVGKAGALLTDIITKGMGLEREEVYIANVVKCRPPENRDPTPAEKALCTPWLDRQIELVDPRVLIPLGRHAAGHLLGSEASMGALRGRVHEARGRKVVPTFHPAYLLRSPAQKKECWADIRLAMAELGLEPKARTKAAGRGGEDDPQG
jgi:DNA polymerase